MDNSNLRQIHIKDGPTYLDNCKEIEEFFEDLYIPAFPNDEEREPVENIVNRIRYDSKPITELILLIDGDEVVAGCVVDLFPEAKTIHTIYIVVKDTYRRRGLARLLLDSWFDIHPDYLDMYVEVDDPDVVTPENTVIDPRTRIEIYSKMDFSLLHLKYVQPPLEEGLPYAYGMKLMYRTRDSHEMSSRLKIFLTEFYQGLNCPDTDPELIKMLNQIDKL